MPGKHSLVFSVIFVLLHTLLFSLDMTAAALAMYILIPESMDKLLVIC